MNYPPTDLSDLSAEVADLIYGLKLTDAFVAKAQMVPADKVHWRATQLFTRIFELAGASLALHDAKFWTAIPTVARSSVEAMADLLALQKNPAHLGSIDRRDLDQEDRLWNDAIAQQHEALKEGLASPTAVQDLQWLQSKRAALKGATSSVKGVFKDADCETLYAVHYNRLCVETHNNGSSLRERHAGIDPVSGRRQIAYLKYPTQATKAGLYSATGALKVGLSVLAEMFGKMDLLRQLDWRAPEEPYLNELECSGK